MKQKVQKNSDKIGKFYLDDKGRKVRVSGTTNTTLANSCGTIILYEKITNNLFLKCVTDINESFTEITEEEYNA